MCFYNDDADWSASVCETTPADTGEPCKCDECGRKITTDEWRLNIFMQEHEDCQICEDDCSDEFISREDMEAELADGDAEWAAAHLKTLENHTCDFGETFRYVRCKGCDEFLQAIEAQEIEEGCPPDSRRPALCDLHNSMAEHGLSEIYGKKAIAMFPHLKDHPIVIMALRPTPGATP